MTDSLAQSLVEAATNAEADDLIHLHCRCAPDVALCGVDLTGCPMAQDSDPEDECPLCILADEDYCARCGE